MLCSAGYHLFRCHSEKASHRWLALDLTGISIGILGVYLPGVHYAFYCLSVSHSAVLKSSICQMYYVKKVRRKIRMKFVVRCFSGVERCLLGYCKLSLRSRILSADQCQFLGWKYVSKACDAVRCPCGVRCCTINALGVSQWRLRRRNCACKWYAIPIQLSKNFHVYL